MNITQKPDRTPPAQASSAYEMQVLRSIRKIMRAVDLHSRKIHADLSVTLPQLLCLHALADQDGLTLQSLSHAVNLSNSTVNGIVDRLESKMFVKRTRANADRRRVALTLTRAGRDLVDSAPSLLQDRFAEALRRLPELEQATISLSLGRVVDLMEARHIDASPNLLPSGAIEESPQGTPP
jgi:MarR family transcriptional regulator, organic hydroperoxide resistance regulator